MTSVRRSYAKLYCSKTATGDESSPRRRTCAVGAELIGTVWEVVTKRSPLRRVVLQLTMAKVDQGLLNPDTVSCTVPEEFGEDVLSLTRNRDRMVDGSFPAAVLRAIIKENDDEYASPHSASVKETASK
jgi:hypothetical protein